MTGKTKKQKGKEFLGKAGTLLINSDKTRKSREKKLKSIMAVAGVLVVLLNMWQDHKEAVFKDKL